MRVRCPSQAFRIIPLSALLSLVPWRSIGGRGVSVTIQRHVFPIASLPCLVRGFEASIVHFTKGNVVLHSQLLVITTLLK
jgi:hypothetical protein